jgi:Tol biopolymer transport system component/predicted Ser/Thr protein kinase
MTPERWQKIEQLYHAALEREESQRPAYLYEICAGDDTLRREVESLLVQGKAGDGFLESPAMDVAARAVAIDPRHSLNGKQLGSYKIVSMVGAGGMGEVYKARDTRLDRIVAIKVLPAHLADRADLRERFDREAKTIASLNHPHICTLYDIGHEGEIDFLVMEYLEGETLAQRLLKGSLPLEQVLRYAIEIADALDKAHRKGITHRDLKPANIMLTKSGTKLLDFGLAKLTQEAALGTPESRLPTLKSAVTAEGTILGTLQYMAPEQLEGNEVDARTDIFSFGAVVYEMATGKRAFEGKTQASVIGAIMSIDPPLISSLQPMTPPALDRVVKKCLAKEPDNRWHAIKDLCDEVKWIAESGSQAGAATAPAGPASKNRRKTLVWGAVSLLACAIIGMTVWILKPAPPRPVTRFTLSLPPDQRLAGLDAPAIALSPDGTRLAYVATQSGVQEIYLRAMDSSEVRMIPGTEGARAPFFSPDGQWVGFFAENKLEKISLSGGAPVTICDAPGNSLTVSASWGADDNIVFQSGTAAGLRQVSAAGGTPKLLSTPDSKKGETTHRFPELLPGGKAVLFAAGQSATVNLNNARIVVRSLQTGETRDLIGGTYPSYAPTGHLVYAQAGTLMAVSFDPRRLAVTGASVPMLESVLQSPTSGVVQYSFSNTGSVAYVPGGLQAVQRKLVWVDRKGTEQPLPTPSHPYRTPRLSPDGRRVVVAISDQLGDHIWLYDLTRDTLTRLTFEGTTNSTPIWTPDGKRITFGSTRGGSSASDAFWQPADGSGSAEALTMFRENRHNMGSWSPDGQVLSFEEINPVTRRDVWVYTLSDRKAHPFLNTQFNETAPEFSPDGHWLAYASDESGRYEIYVQPYPGPGGKWQISTEGGTEPRWTRDGEIFYRSGTKMMAVDTKLKPTFSADKPKMLFEGQYVPSLATMHNYDVSQDGQRFLMVKDSDQATLSTQINVVLNWFEELKRRVPAKQQ